MKLNKRTFKEMIYEVLAERLGAPSTSALEDPALSAAQISKTMKSSEATKEVGTLTARERKIFVGLQQVQKALSRAGDQASPKIVRLVKLMIDDLATDSPDTDTGEPQ